MASPPPTFSPSEIASLHGLLLPWFSANRRRLPWRGDPYGEGDAPFSLSPFPNPYATWVSEIMLQQTRVDTVVPHFVRFLTRWPTVAALAAATQDEVVGAWGGLGYYRRARLLHTGATTVLSSHGGVLPSTTVGLTSIPGIGPYTAGAIASIAFGVPTPLVDGNVIRVFSRLRALAQDAKSPALAKTVWAVAGTVVAPAAPGAWNEALMELGATVCTPTSPNCGGCPLVSVCEAAKEARAAVAAGTADVPVGDVEDVVPPPRKAAGRKGVFAEGGVKRA